MRLPRFIASTAVRETGLVRAGDIGALTDVGDAEFRAIQQAGQAIGAVSDLGLQAFMSRQAMDDELLMGQANMKAKEALGLELTAIGSRNFKAEERLSTDPKYWTTDDLYNTGRRTADITTAQKSYISKIRKLAAGIKNPHTRETWINQQILNGNGNITNAYNDRFNEYQKTETIANARALVLNGDFEVAEELIDKATGLGLFTHGAAAKLKTELVKEFFQNSAATNAEATIEALDKEIAAREKGKGGIPVEIMTDADLRQSRKEVLVIQKENIVAFENDFNSKLVAIDNTPDLSQTDFDAQAKALKTDLLLANIPGTQKRKMLTDLERWRRGTNEIDYARILALNQEMDAAQRSGIVDPTIEARIINASLEGAFGGRNKGGQKNYGIMIRRFGKLKFDERIQATASIVRTFERENADDPRLIFLFHQAKNKIIAESPDATMRDLFVTVSALANVYSILPEAEIVEKMTRPEGEAAPIKEPVIEKELRAGPGAIPSRRQVEANLKPVGMTDRRIRMVNPKGAVFKVIPKDVEKKKRDGWSPLITVTTQAEYDKLLSGTHYIDANGTHGVKP